MDAPSRVDSPRVRVNPQGRESAVSLTVRSMSDLDIVIQEHHAGELSREQTVDLVETLTEAGMLNLLHRETYEELST